MTSNILAALCVLWLVASIELAQIIAAPRHAACAGRFLTNCVVR